MPMKREQSVPKRRLIKFRRRGITQKKTYNVPNYCLFSLFLIIYFSCYRHAGCSLELHGNEFLAIQPPVISTPDYFVLNGFSQQAVAHRDPGYEQL
jgi:hypothetical protein